MLLPTRLGVSSLSSPYEYFKKIVALRLPQTACWGDPSQLLRTYMRFYQQPFFCVCAVVLCCFDIQFWFSLTLLLLVFSVPLHILFPLLHFQLFPFFAYLLLSALSLLLSLSLTVLRSDADILMV